MSDHPAPAEESDGEPTVAESHGVLPPEVRSDETTVFAGAPGPLRTGAGPDEEQSSGDAAAGDGLTHDDGEVVDLTTRYTFLGPLGQGGMGTVTLAMDGRLGRKVAIKRISGEAAANRRAVARFVSEARAIAALNHPNIVQIFDYGRAADGPFLIMEYVDGGSLLDRCKAGPMPLADAIALACRICDGLGQAHDQRIIHRDIKPANVLVSMDGVPKLTDFGLAKAQADDHGHSITAPGVVLGTADFMPPEQRRSASLVDHRSDLWSLAATVYQMVTGRSPRVIRLGDVPPGLAPVLARALEDDKDARYQSARELRDALAASLRPDTGVSATGQCPTCGMPNEPGRKFCRGCAGSLEAPCLSCGEPLPIREEVCGGCGARQTPLVETKRGETARLQARAEGLLGDLDFDRATEVAAGLRGTADPRVGPIDAWVDTFLDTVDAARRRWTDEAVAAVARAAAHERVFDRTAAARELEAVPPSLRGTVLPGAAETVAAALARVDAAVSEIRRLESRIAAAAATPDDDGLLHDVERLLRLVPHDPQALSLRDEVLGRQRRRERAWADAVARATDLLSRSRHAEALAVLAALPGPAPAEATRLRARLEQAADRVRGLAARMRDAVTTGRLDGLADLADAYLRLEPADAEALKLKAMLAARDGKLAAATTLEQAGRFAEAAEVLDGIRGFRADRAAAEGRRRCQQAVAERKRAMTAIAAARPGTFDEAIAGSAGYRALLAATGARDVEFAAALQAVERGRGEEQTATRRRRRLGVVAGTVAVALAIATAGLGIRGRMGAAATARARRAEAVAALPAAEIHRLPPVVNSIGLAVKLLPAGTFMMGDPQGHGGEQPRLVTLPGPFCIGVSEVTNAQWARVMGDVPSHAREAEHPVENVSWDDAVEFCRRLSALPAERRAGRTYRLPTEAEWEFACRAGSTTAYAFGDDEAALGDHGWFDGNAGAGTHAVGTRRANAWGLVDMHGNVWEWCGDHGSGDEPAAHGRASAAAERVYRGGGWSGDAAACRSPARLAYDRASRFDFIGFRVALSASPDLLLDAAEPR